MSHPGPSNSDPADPQLTVGAAAAVQSMQEEMQNMRTLVEMQQSQIAQLTREAKAASAARTAAVQPPTSMVHSAPIQTPKIPQIATYSGARDEQTSTKVKAFIYSVKKVGRLGKMTGPGMLELADCYFRDRAATWMMNLEMNDNKPDTIANLQDAMIKEFVPDEKARSKTRLMKHKLTKSVDWYVSAFRDLVEVCGTPMSEAYLFFFNGLTDEYKEEFTKMYPTGEPASMQDVYEHARTLERAMQWNEKSPKRGNDRPLKGEKERPQLKKRDKPKDNSKMTKPKTHDKDALFWGPAGDSEKFLYRRNARCYDCGGKYSPSHECEDKKGKVKDSHSPADDSPNE